MRARDIFRQSRVSARWMPFGWTVRAILAATLVWMLCMVQPTSHAAEETLPDAAEAAGICVRCHERQAVLAVETGGHATGVICEDCHQNRRPGRFGRRHSKIVSCASHHGEKGHPERARTGRSAKRKRNIIRNCIKCHEPHGAENTSLIRDVVRAGRRRLAPVVFNNQNGAALGGFTNPVEPGTGLCEVCHRRTFFYRRDGRGPHFTESCVSCHEHEDGFDP